MVGKAPGLLSGHCVRGEGGSVLPALFLLSMGSATAGCPWLSVCPQAQVLSFELGLKCCAACFAFRPLSRCLKSSVT